MKASAFRRWPVAGAYSPEQTTRLTGGSDFAKQIPLEVGLYQDDFSDEKSVLTGTKRKTAFLLFFASTVGLRLPRIQTYIAENFYF